MQIAIWRGVWGKSGWNGKRGGDFRNSFLLLLQADCLVRLNKFDSDPSDFGKLQLRLRGSKDLVAVSQAFAGRFKQL